MIAGVKRLKLDERLIEPSDVEREAIEASLAEEMSDAQAAREERHAAGFTTNSEAEVQYSEYDRWKQDMSSQEIVEIPGDPTILESDEVGWGCRQGTTPEEELPTPGNGNYVYVMCRRRFISVPWIIGTPKRG